MALFKFEKIAIKHRWISLLLAIVLFSVAFLKGEITIATLAFLIGASAGLFIDYIGIRQMKLWKYSRQKFLGIKYFGIVVPAWGVFGMMVNLLWNWFCIPEIVMLGGLTAGLFGLYELPNLKIKSWEYKAPMWTVGIGWIPLIVVLRILFMTFA